MPYGTKYNGFSLARPFFFLCLLSDSSLLSKSGFLFFPLALPVCAAGWVPGLISLTASGAAPAFSTSGSGVEFVGPTAFRPPSAGTVVPLAPELRISTPPMWLPVVAGGVGAAPEMEVVAEAPLAAPSAAAGTSESARGAAGAAGAAGAELSAAAALLSVGVVAGFAASGAPAAGALGFSESVKSDLILFTTCGAIVGVGSAKVGSPSRAAMTTSGWW